MIERFAIDLHQLGTKQGLKQIPMTVCHVELSLVVPLEVCGDMDQPFILIPSKFWGHKKHILFEENFTNAVEPVRKSHTDRYRPNIARRNFGLVTRGAM